MVVELTETGPYSALDVIRAAIHHGLPDGLPLDGYNQTCYLLNHVYLLTLQYFQLLTLCVTSNYHAISFANQCFYSFTGNLSVCRGSKPGAVDSTGKTSLEIAVEKGAITDEELFLMLSEANR